MRLTKLIKNKTDKYLEHFLKYNRINHIIQIENENEKYCKDKKEEQKSTQKDISNNNNKESYKKDSYPEFHKEGFPWE